MRLLLNKSFLNSNCSYKVDYVQFVYFSIYYYLIVYSTFLVKLWVLAYQNTNILSQKSDTKCYFNSLVSMDLSTLFTILCR